MADKYSDQYTLAYVNVPSEKIAKGEEVGRIRSLIMEHTFSGEFVAADSLFMGKLPKGARLVEAILKSPDLGTTGLLDVGWDGGTNSLETADPNGIFAAADVKAAAVVHAMSDAFVPGVHKKFIDEVNIVIDANEDTDVADGLSISLVLYYILD